MRTLCLIVLLTFVSAALAAPAHNHDHDHDHAAEAPTTQPAELTREQVVAPVLDARKAYKAQRLAALRDFAAKVDAVKGDDATALKAELTKNIADVEADRYVLTYAAEEDPFTIAALAEARAAYVDQLEVAHDVYYKALQAALRNDHHGYIGDMLFAELETTIDTDLMWQLMDYYWHHGNLDNPPGTFERTIVMSYRFVQLEPQSPQIYANAAWLLWSRWVKWKQQPDWPRGEGDDARAIDFLLAGRKALPTDAAYHFDAAMTVWGLAKHHDRKVFSFILDSLKLADEHATEPKLKVRTRLMLGHTYRELKQLKLAREAYQRVLEVEPDNAPASRLITEIDAGDYGPIE